MRQLNSKIDFYQSIPFFKHQTQNSIKKLVNGFQEHTYSMNQFVFHQDATPTHVYIIKEGLFQILRKERSVQNRILDDEQSYNCKKYLNIGNEWVDPLRCKNKKIRDSRFKGQVFNLGLIGRGHLLGFADIILNKQNSISVKSVSETGIICQMDFKEFCQIA